MVATVRVLPYYFLTNWIKNFYRKRTWYMLDMVTLLLILSFHLPPYLFHWSWLQAAICGLCNVGRMCPVAFCNVKLHQISLKVNCFFKKSKFSWWLYLVMFCLIPFVLQDQTSALYMCHRVLNRHPKGERCLDSRTLPNFSP